MANFYNFPNDPDTPKKISVKLPNAENALVEDVKLFGYDRTDRTNPLCYPDT